MRGYFHFRAVPILLAISSGAVLPTIEAICSTEIEGIIAAVFTPVYDNGSLALEYVRPYAQFLKDNGVNGVLVGSTTGEGPTLNEDENKELLDAWMEAATPLDIFVLSSVGGVPIPFTLEMTTYSEKVGAAGVVAMPEVYFKPQNPEELLYNMQLIAEAAPNTPLIYDDIPQYTRVYVDMVEFYDLASKRIPTFKGIKSSVLDNLLLLTPKIKGDKKLYSSNYYYPTPLFPDGNPNYITDIVNIFPRLAIETANSSLRGDADSFERTNELYEELLDLLDIVTDGNIAGDKGKARRIAPTKQAMIYVTGINVGPVRPPLVPYTEDQKEQLKAKLEANNITVYDLEAK